MKRAFLSLTPLLILLTACASGSGLVINESDTRPLEQIIYEYADFTANIDYRYFKGEYFGNVLTSGMSGFLVDHNGEKVVVTAGHIHKPDYTITGISVSFKGESDKRYKMKLVAANIKKDIAVLRFTGDIPDITPAVFADYNTVNSGDFVLNIGSPQFGRIVVPHTRSTGKVISTNRKTYNKGELHSRLWHDASAYYGSSGGVVLNKHGQVIGMDISGKWGEFNKNGQWCQKEPDEEELPSRIISVPSDQIQKWLDTVL